MSLITFESVKSSGLYRLAEGQWKKALTAEEVVLIVMELEHFNSINKAAQKMESTRDCAVISNAEAIRLSLLDEIILVDSLADNVDERILADTYLFIASRVTTDNGGSLNPEKTTITRKSAAQWFLAMGDNYKASLLMPSILDDVSPVVEQDISNPAYNPRTPEASLLDSLGMMAILLSKQSKSLASGEKPNATAILRAVAQAAALHSFPLEKVTNLNKDISAAVEKVLSQISK